MTESHELPRILSQRIFDDYIVPNELDGLAQERPLAVVVAGQPGAGKSSAQRQVLVDLGVSATVEIDADVMRTYHPRWLELCRADDLTAADKTHADAKRWTDMAVRYAIGRRFNLVLSATLSSANGAANLLDLLRGEGYRTIVVVVAVHESLSRAGILARYNDQRVQQGFGRFVSRDVHDEAYAGILRSVDYIDSAYLCDQVYVCARNSAGVYLYENSIVRPQMWSKQPHTRTAVEQERTRRWSLDERESFLRLLDELDTSLPTSLRSQLTKIRELAEPLLPVFHEKAFFDVPDGDGSSAPPRTRLRLPRQPRGEHDDLPGGWRLGENG
jgi:UDP-N-acetylglucosamine kinase